ALWVARRGDTRRRQHRHPCLPRPPGGAQQRRTPFWRRRSPGASAVRSRYTDARGRGSRSRVYPERRSSALGAGTGRHARARGPAGRDARYPSTGRWRPAGAAEGSRQGGSRDMTETTSVLLVDDHALVRRGFRRMLEDDPSIRVVGEASNVEEAVRLTLELKPNVVVMDCAMPGGNGLVATRTIVGCGA